MKRGTIFLILFILVAAGVVGASLFFRNQAPLKVTIAVDALAADWVKDAVAQYNASNPLVNATRRVQLEATVMSDMDVWRGSANWTPQNHPTGWVASSSIAVNYAKDNGLPLSVIQPSTARTLLVWGGYKSRVDVITQKGAKRLDWDTVQAAAKAESWSALGGSPDWQFVKLGFGLPDRTMSGLAVLFSGAASFSQTPNLATNAVGSTGFYNWMQPIVDSVPNFQTLGGDVAKAVSRGPSTVEIAILPESQWLLNLSAITANETVELGYPTYQFIFDFPVALWDDSQTTDDQRAAVKAFGAWLLNAQQQNSAIGYGLRPASGDPPQTAGLFTSAVADGIQLSPDVAQAIVAPARADAQGLIQWFLSH
jgi:hypothetical protein